jgi:hypothetical protein
MKEQFELPLEVSGEQLELPLEFIEETPFGEFKVNSIGLTPWLLTVSNFPIISFHDPKTGKIATLSWESGCLKFEGAADESAIIFFNELISHIDTKAKKYKNV